MWCIQEKSALASDQTVLLMLAPWLLYIYTVVVRSFKKCLCFSTLN